MSTIIELDPNTYKRHLIHGEGRGWAETNCYADVLIELIHSLGFEPIAALPFTLTNDFEVDQWTFFKFRHQDLLDLFGMEVHELNPWRSLAHHVEAQVQAGRPVLVEVDSFFLPDTHGTAYKLNHVKSTIAVTSIDIEACQMGYFHGQGYYHLDGQDMRDLFQLDGLVHDRVLPPYIELVKLHQLPDTSTESLVEQSVSVLRDQLRVMPTENPFHKFAVKFKQDFDWLLSEPIDMFHLYSFATLRQYGACFELAETYLQWLANHGQQGLEPAISAYAEISTTAKTFQFKLARAIARKKELPLSPIDDMAASWQQGADLLTDKYL